MARAFEVAAKFHNIVDRQLAFHFFAQRWATKQELQVIAQLATRR